MADVSVPILADDDIILLMMDHDEAGLRALLIKYAGRLSCFLKRFYGDVLAGPEIKEALDVTIFNAWRFADHYDEKKGTLASWLLRIAQRSAQGIIRREVRHRHKDLEYDPHYDPAGEADVDGSPSDGNKDRRLQEFEMAISKLPPLQRAIIRADLAAGGDVPACAARLAQIHGTTKNSIIVSRHKARETLHREMQRRGHFAEVKPR